MMRLDDLSLWLRTHPTPHQIIAGRPLLRVMLKDTEKEAREIETGKREEEESSGVDGGVSE